ncbi:uncharacterized protein LOC129578456 isoform X2 [Sitodiplosis mosellana]|nr:uncharacterized protein LOC129578456 isoform X2 [Sitodiplosis mosellana]
MKRIYIDFASDEDLACIQTPGNVQNTATDADTEETIKLLLDHIDTLPETETERDNDCEFCKSILEAFDDLQTEKEKFAQALNEKSKECANLIDQNNHALKCIEELQMKIKASEHDIYELNERLDALEHATAAIQSENLLKDDIIREYDIERKITNQRVQELTVQLKKITNEHTGMFRVLQTICKGIWPLKLLSMYGCSKPFKRLHANELMNCKAVVPFCGNIDNWEYIMIPVIKNVKLKRKN